LNVPTGQARHAVPLKKKPGLHWQSSKLSRCVKLDPIVTEFKGQEMLQGVERPASKLYWLAAHGVQSLIFLKTPAATLLNEPGGQTEQLPPSGPKRPGAQTQSVTKSRLPAAAPTVTVLTGQGLQTLDAAASANVLAGQMAQSATVPKAVPTKDLNWPAGQTWHVLPVPKWPGPQKQSVG
jgi:hypothetical protein